MGFISMPPTGEADTRKRFSAAWARQARCSSSTATQTPWRTPERLLGGFSEAYYTRTMEIHVLAQGITSSDRDATFSTLVAGIGDVIEADLTVGGRGGITNYAAPTSEVYVPDTGGAAVKAGTIFLTMEYETTNPLG